MKLRKFIKNTICEYLNEELETEKELTDFSIKENIYYHGTSSNIGSDFVFSDKIKEFDYGSTSWSKFIQGLGKFYTNNIENAYSFIDFRGTDVGNIIEIDYKSKNSYNSKNINNLITILQDYGTKNNFDNFESKDIIKRNLMFVNDLIKQGYDSIVLREGPKYNPNRTKLKSTVIIPLVKNNIKVINIYKAKSRNGGIFHLNEQQVLNENFIAYHGANEKFDTFSLGYRNPELDWKDGVNNFAHFFATKIEDAKRYGDIVFKVKLNIKNTLNFKDIEVMTKYEFEAYMLKKGINVGIDTWSPNSNFEIYEHLEMRKGLKDLLIKLGYDSIIFKEGKGYTIAVFDNENIEVYK
jgi:hypothetical protein